MDVGDWGALIAVVISISGVVLAWRKFPHETRSTDADAAEKYQRVADMAADKALKLSTRIDELEKKVDDQEKVINQLRNDNEDLKEWADRLVHQVRSLGGVPVQIRLRAKES